MTGPVFVDTNVFIYALDRAELKKQQAARDWRAELWKSRRGKLRGSRRGPRSTDLAACDG